MIDRLEATLKRYNEIGEELANPEIISDIKQMTLLSKERTGLEKTVEVYKEYKKVLDDIEEAKELLKDKDMAEFAKEELSSAEEKKDKLESELEVLLIPHDPNDDKNVIVEIRGAAGGDEANIFAGNLFDMYSKYANNEGWSIDVLNSTISRIYTLTTTATTTRNINSNLTLIKFVIKLLRFRHNKHCCR